MFNARELAKAARAKEKKVVKAEKIKGNKQEGSKKEMESRFPGNVQNGVEAQTV